MALLSGNRIKFIRSLSRKKFRDETGLFIAEGEKLVSEALKSSFSIREIYRTDEIGKEAMGRISALSSPSPVVSEGQQLYLRPYMGMDGEQIGVGGRPAFV